MDNKDNQTTEQYPVDAQRVKTLGDAVDSRRRRIAGAGLSAPVLMTLASRPALAKQCSASVLASGNLSDPVDTSTCGACTETQWYYQPSNSRVWQSLGIDPDMMGCGGVFSIPSVDNNGTMEPICSATIRDALQALVSVSSALRFRDANNGKVRRAAGRQRLAIALCSFLGALLNSAYAPTAFNWPYPSNQVLQDVNSVLVLYGNKKQNKINIDAVDQLSAAYLAAMGNGSSCALPS